MFLGGIEALPYQSRPLESDETSKFIVIAKKSNACTGKKKSVSTWNLLRNKSNRSKLKLDERKNGNHD
jgi:hypothetical protein